MAQQLAYLIDCMEYMRTLPDNAFDLAVVDTPYGGVTKGGYMKNQGCENKAKRINYDLELWKQTKPDQAYFDELFRVSRNQVIWGGQLLSDKYQT